MDDIHARAPVNKMAAIVTAKGFHFEPNKIVLANDSETPHKTATITNVMVKNPSFVNLTGKVFGRFVVIGLAEDFKGRWVVKCSCGRYSTRSKKAITNKENTQDRCEHCRYLVFLKRDEHFRNTGHFADIRGF